MEHYHENSGGRLLLQSYHATENVDSVLFQDHDHEEVPSRAGDNHSPAINSGDYPKSHDTYRQYHYSTVAEPRSSSQYPVSQVDNRAAPCSTNPPIANFGHYYQAAHGLYKHTGSTRQSFYPGSEAAFSPPHPAPLTFIDMGSRPGGDIRCKKLCNDHHLRGTCRHGPNCQYGHGSIHWIQVEDLRRVKKAVPCKKGLACTDELCYWGHKCPYKSTLCEHCDFPAEMHYVGRENIRGRLATNKDRRKERFRKKNAKRQDARKNWSATELTKYRIEELMHGSSLLRNDI